MEYVETRLILISVHATPAEPPRNLRANRPTLEREVAASGVGVGGGESKERMRGRVKEKRGRERKRETVREKEREKEHKRTRLTGDRRKRTGGEIGLARRTFHGRRERPSGVALCHIQPPTTVGSPSFK